MTPDAGAEDDTPSSRIEGIDAWRALLMLGGLFVHATWLQEDHPLFFAIALTSASFRMGAFFVISGLLSGFALRKRPAQSWLRARLVQIAVPTAFALAVICPLITLLLQAPSGTPSSFKVDWYHIWFLVALLLYTGLAYAAHLLDCRFDLFERAWRKAGNVRAIQPLVLIGIALLSFVLMILTARAMLAVLPETYLPRLTQLRLITGYAPVYLLGFALARSAAFRDAMLASRMWPIVILASIAAAYASWYGFLLADLGDLVGEWGGFIDSAGESLGPPAAAVLILKSAVKIRKIPSWMRRLSEASFTIYIVHVPIILLINLGFARIAWNLYLEFTIAVLAGGLVSYGLHAFVVKRSPVLSLLMNGRLRRPPSAPPALSPAAL